MSTADAWSKVRVLLVGDFSSWEGSLEGSLARSFRTLNCSVETFDLAAAVQRSCRLGPVGNQLNTYLPIDAWVRRANRDMVVAARRFLPTVTIVVGQAAVQAGSLAQLMAATGSASVLVWPDTLVNLSDRVVSKLALYDLVASYSETAVPLFERLGATRVRWVPLAADLDLHKPGTMTSAERARYACDVSFIGNWRPERERALSALARVPGLAIRIWGGDAWSKSADRAVRGAWQGGGLYGAEFAKACAASRLCLNVIDDTNFPAANMRFFEIPATKSAQLASSCPEFETEFVDGEHIYYYRGEQHLPARVSEILRAPGASRDRVAEASWTRVRDAHTYAHRAEEILKQLSLKETS